MGNPDNWTTPKQIKIEREGEPRGVKRGPLKKGERKKGKKARIDEVLAARNEVRRYAEWLAQEAQRRREHPEWYQDVRTIGGRRYKPYEPMYQKWYDKAYAKYENIVANCVKDGVFTLMESKEYSI